jgi:hypothetical protein
MSICRVAFREWFGLSRAQAEILSALYETHDRFLGADELARRGGVTRVSISYQMVVLRQALDPEAIDTERGLGYRLTDEGRAECRSAILQVGEELRRAS